MLDLGWWHHQLMRCKYASGNNPPSSRFKGAWALFFVPTFQTTSLMVSSIDGDNFRVIPRNRVICFGHLNSVDPSIQFTVERGKDRRLSFLDLNVYRTDHENSLETGVHRKPTHTDKYLAFDSRHPICQKKSVTKTLFMRAECLPSSSDSKAFERKYVIDVLKENNYLKIFFKTA